MVVRKQMIWASRLPSGMSAHKKAELVALIQAQRMAEGTSTLAAGMLLPPPIYRQRGLLTFAEIFLSLLEATQLPKKIATIH